MSVFSLGKSQEVVFSRNQQQRMFSDCRTSNVELLTKEGATSGSQHEAASSPSANKLIHELSMSKKLFPSCSAAAFS